MELSDDELIFEAATYPAVCSGSSSRGRGRGRGAKAKKQAVEGRHVCLICCDPSKKCCGNNPYCHACKPDHDGLKRDAEKTGNLDRLERAKSDPILMQMLVEDYRQQVGPAKRGVQRPLYKWSRIETHLIQATMEFQGQEVETWDFFDFKEHYEKRKFSDSQILQKWRAKIAVPSNVVDRNGENADFPERIEWSRRVRRFGDETREETATMRGTKEAGCYNDGKWYAELEAAGWQSKAASLSAHSLAKKPNSTPAEPPSPKKARVNEAATARLGEKSKFRALLADAIKMIQGSVASYKPKVEQIMAGEYASELADYADIIHERFKLANLCTEGLDQIRGKADIPDLIEVEEAAKSIEDKLQSAIGALKSEPFKDSQRLIPCLSAIPISASIAQATDMETLNAAGQECSFTLGLYGQLVESIKLAVNHLVHGEKTLKLERKKQENQAKKDLKKAEADAANKVKRDVGKTQRALAAMAESTTSRLFDLGSKFATPVRSFDEIADVDEIADATVFTEPLVIKKATAVKDVLAEEASAALANKVKLFQRDYLESDPVSRTGRALTRAKKGAEGVFNVTRAMFEKLDRSATPTDALKEEVGMKIVGIGSNRKFVSPVTTPTFFYIFSGGGSRSLTLLAMPSLLQFMIHKQSDPKHMSDVIAFCRHGVSEQIAQEMMSFGCRLKHVEQKAEELLFVPPGYVQWESIGDPSHGMRFGALFKVSETETAALELMMEKMKDDQDFAKDSFAIVRDMVSVFGGKA